MSRINSFLKSSPGVAFVALAITMTLGIIIGPIVADKVFGYGQDHAVPSILKVSDDGENLATENMISMAAGFRQVARTFKPYVVNVRTRSVQSGASRSIPQPLERLFGDQGANQPRELRSQGSGTIVDPQGFILTNTHVVTRQDRRRGGAVAADRVEVMLNDGESYTAKVIGFDSQADIAVLKIDADKPLPTASIGDTSSMQIGDWVLAMGSPFGLEQTVTAGIVSAKGRAGDRFGFGANLFGDYLQTDAAINPGNSGGPLINMKGQLIGINTFITSRSGGSQGVGFAIPSHVFVNAYNQLVANGRIERGWLGVSMNILPMTPAMAEFFGVAGNDPKGIKDGDGVLITHLVGEDQEPSDSGPAARAGIRAEDVVVKIGNREIETPFDLRSIVASTPPGDNLPITVVRKGRVVDLNVRLARRKVEENTRRNNRSLSFEDEPEEEKNPKEIGLGFHSLSEREAQEVQLDSTEKGRVFIDSVVPTSLAHEAGLAPGQLVTHVNGRPLDSADDFYDAVQNLKSGESAVLRVVIPTRDADRIFYTSFVKP